MKASACCLSPSKIWGSEPIMCTLGFAAIGTKCAIGIGAGAPPPGPPGPPGPLGPPGPPPDGGPGPVQRRAASRASLMSRAYVFVAPPPGAVPLPAPPVSVPLVVAVGAAGAVVVVDVRAIVADPIISFDCFIVEKGLRSLASVVGVMRGIQGSRSSRCVLPGLLVSIVACAYQKVVLDSLLSSVVESLAVGSSGWVSSATSVACTSARIGPKNGL